MIDVRILIAWADDISTNLGVRALAAGASSFVSKAFPGATVEFQSFGQGAAPAPITERSLLYAALGIDQSMRKWLGTYDLVLDMRAGDSFADIYGVRRVLAMNALFEISRRAGAKVVLGPQTIGPFNTRIGRALGRRVLSTADAVFSRDSTSSEFSTKLGRPVNCETTDLVFCIPQPEAAPKRDVGLNVSGLLWQPGPHIDNLKYRKDISELCRRLTAAGRSITLFPHVLTSDDPDNDMPAVNELNKTFGNEFDVYTPTGLADVRSFVASCNVVIGSRMHACLNALSVGTPAIPLSYSRKFQPLLSDLGWGHNVDLKTETHPAEAVMAILDRRDLTSDVQLVLEKSDLLIQRGIASLQECVIA